MIPVFLIVIIILLGIVFNYLAGESFRSQVGKAYLDDIFLKYLSKEEDIGLFVMFASPIFVIYFLFISIIDKKSGESEGFGILCVGIFGIFYIGFMVMAHSVAYKVIGYHFLWFYVAIGFGIFRYDIFRGFKYVFSKIKINESKVK